MYIIQKFIEEFIPFSSLNFSFENARDSHYRRGNCLSLRVAFAIKKLVVSTRERRGSVVCCATIFFTPPSSSIPNSTFDKHWYFPGIQPISPASVNGEFSLKHSSRMPTRVVANSISWARQSRELEIPLSVYSDSYSWNALNTKESKRSFSNCFMYLYNIHILSWHKVQNANYHWIAE